MAVKFYIYLDYGAGDVLINPYSLQTKLTWKRGVINDYIARKELNGTFQLIKDEFDTAKTFFIDNGNYEAVIKVYENGIKGVGVLQYEGWARVKGEWNFRERIVTFNSFRTNDQYTIFLPYIDEDTEGEGLIGFGVFNEFHAQGQNTNANKLLLYTWDGTNFNLSGTAATSVTDIGRVGAAGESGEVVLLDSSNSTLESYTNVGGAWTLQRSLAVPFSYKSVDIAGLTGNQVAVIGGDGLLDVYQYSGATFSLVSTANVSDVRFPSLAVAGSQLVIVDELTKTLRGVGTATGVTFASFSVGDILKPSICTLNTGSNRIAFIDAKQKVLKAFSLSGTTWSQVGNGLPISGLFSPAINQYGTDAIILHDTIKGTLEHYAFDGTNWTKTGNTTSLSGGYMSAVAVSTNVLVAISDTFPFNCSIMQSYYGLINSLLLVNSIWGVSAPNYELQSTGNGSTLDVNKLILGNMSDLADNFEDAGTYNRYKYKLDDLLKYYELFQNYWYIDSSNKIKFIQPSLFSSIGTDIDVSSMQAATELNIRVYKDEFLIDSEELILNNADGSEFDGNIIDYSRNTPVKETVVYPFTTDLNYLIEIYTGQVIEDINSSGLVAYYKDALLTGNMCASGTGIVSTLDTKNYLLSQSQIYNDFWKDYRYKEQGNILINGSSSATQDTCRNIIEYEDIEFNESDVGITQFPASIGSIIWGGAIPNSFIMELSIDLFSCKYTASSRLLDI